MVKTPDITKASDKASGDIKDMLAKIQALGGGLTVSDEVKVELVVSTMNAGDAKDLRELAKAGLDGVLIGLAAFTNPTPEVELVVDVLKTIRITNSGQAVVIKGRVTSDVIEDAIKKKSK